MAIEHSEASKVLARYSAAAAPQEINFPILQDRLGTIFARPLSCADVDKVGKYSGHEYNVRLCMAACQTADGKPLFNAEDFADLYANRGTAEAFAVAAIEIMKAQSVDYELLKKV